MNVTVIKASGDKVFFEASKLRQSLERSGANETVIAQIIDEVESSLYDGISTKEIYKKAFDLLRKSSRPTAARYNLKKAIYELGPSGFPFEKYVAAILEHEGFQTRVGVIVKGHCVNHEVDVVAEKNEHHIMVECKFHSTQGGFCNVKIPLYINSRFQDVEKLWRKQEGHRFKFHQGWIFTNTRFTTDAIQYGTCTGLMLVGWNYPEKGSLNQRIDASGLHPVTCLTTLTNSEKQKLLSNDVVMCRKLCDRPEELNSIGIGKQRHEKILDEAHKLCGM
jgi:Holliday junction resolvase